MTAAAPRIAPLRPGDEARVEAFLHRPALRDRLRPAAARAVLFTAADNPARPAYEALGFSAVEEVALVLFR